VGQNKTGCVTLVVSGEVYNVTEKSSKGVPRQERMKCAGTKGVICHHSWVSEPKQNLIQRVRRSANG